jgi:hypothetical protein
MDTITASNGLYLTIIECGPYWRSAGESLSSQGVVERRVIRIKKGRCMDLLTP